MTMTKMTVKRPVALVLICVSAALVAGCSGSGSTHDATPGPDRSVTSPAVAAPAASDRAHAAETVKSDLEQRLSVDEARFGTGTNSPCATSSPKVFTAECGAAVDATAKLATLALAEAGGPDGFRTLTTTAQKIESAVDDYRTLKCASNPSAADTRHKCLSAAAVIAQAHADLRDGANMALSGR